MSSLHDFFELSSEERREALEYARSVSGRPSVLLEKDIWVVLALQILFAAPFGSHLCFKGGTSLSKVYNAISRFSEDVDLTYDIRELLPERFPSRDSTVIPSNRSQSDKWSEDVHKRLPEWIAREVLPRMSEALKGLPASARHDGDNLYIEYDSLYKETGYVRPTVLLEFGGRSTGEPTQDSVVKCDAAPHVPAVSFPEATVRAMRVERTFWEKATAIHVFCRSGRFRGGDRFARHWYDLARLEERGYVDTAIEDRVVAEEVAKHKSSFFRENDRSNQPIDYNEAVNGQLQLVPTNDVKELAEDYQKMVDAGLLHAEAESLEQLLETCLRIQNRANQFVTDHSESDERTRNA